MMRQRLKSANKIKQILFYFQIAALLLILAGCSITQNTTTPEWDEIPGPLSDFPENWTINGRISVIHENENWYARFNWIQQDQDFEIRFTGPLGETELQISQIGQVMRLKTPSTERTTDDIEQLMLQETGWQFPVKSLRFWSRGQPDPRFESRASYNQQKLISDIYQSGWHIQYPKRMQVGKYRLPKKIVVTEQNLKIKIIVTQWFLGESVFQINKG